MSYKANRTAVPEILMGDWVDGLVKRATDAIARQVESRVDDRADEGDTVVVDVYDFVPRGRTVKRHARSVTVRLPHARLLQARDGILTRSAAAVGVEVTAK